MHATREISGTNRWDHKLRIDDTAFAQAYATHKELLPRILEVTDPETLRGLEGAAANSYFGVLNQMILRQKDDFFFRERNRRPPLDNVNAMLSFVYSLLANDCASALESVGLDAYPPFLWK